MSGYVLLRANPYMAKTDANGRFEIAGLSVGKHQFQFWHERAGYLRNVTMGKHRTDKKGRLTMLIQPGANQLPNVALPAEMFHPSKK